MNNTPPLIAAFQTAVAWTRHLKKYRLTIQEAATLLMLKQQPEYQCAYQTVGSLIRKGLLEKGKRLTEQGTALAEELLDDPGPDTTVVPEWPRPFWQRPTNN